MWIVAQTQSQRENLAKRHLERAGFEAYLPRIRRRSANRKFRIVPLFPNYVFVAVREVWAPVMRTIGISKVIKRGEHPAQLEQGVINEIRSREKGGIVQLPKPQPIGRSGQKVRLLSGPFAGHIASLCEAMTDAERQRVLLDFLGRKTVLEIKRSDISLDVQELPAKVDGKKERTRT